MSEIICLVMFPRGISQSQVRYTTVSQVLFEGEHQREGLEYFKESENYIFLIYS